MSTRGRSENFPSRSGKGMLGEEVVVVDMRKPLQRLHCCFRNTWLRAGTRERHLKCASVVTVSFGPRSQTQFDLIGEWLFAPTNPLQLDPGEYARISLC